MRKRIVRIGISFLILLLSACSSAQTFAPQPTVSIEPTPIQLTSVPTTKPVGIDFVPEIKVLEIPLPEPLNQKSMEFSSMAWLGEELILMPQYPNRLNPAGLGVLYAINKADILSYIDQPAENPLPFREILFDDGGLRKSVRGFEGFEAIAFADQQVFMTIETHNGNPMMGYLVSGSFDEMTQQISLDPQSLVGLPPQARFLNASDETLTIHEGRIYTFFEDNGASQNSQAHAHVFDLNLKPEGILPFPNIEYRVTDATETQEDGTFWLMNYFYPGDDHLAAEYDPLIARYGVGETHSQFDGVERIVEMKIEAGGIRLVEGSPLYLRLLLDGASRNWEGIVRLDDIGFLLVTDSFPRTFLGLVQDLR